MCAFKWMYTLRNSLANSELKTNSTIINQQETDQKQILTLEDEGAQEQVVAPIVNTNISKEIIANSTFEQRTHTIPNFLNRLYTLENFQWTKTDVQGEVLKTYRFPDVLLSNPAISAKIRNFFGFRAGIEFVVLVNKQPFQAGNLLISYLPNAKYNSCKSNVHNADKQGIVSRSGAPRTNLDLMDGTRATLTVPYASPFVYYNLLTGEGTIGDFYISVYSPLTDVADSGAVSVQVMARFVDIDLEFPTGQIPTTVSTFNKLTHSIDNAQIEPSREKIVQIRKEVNKLLASIDDGSLKFQSGVSCINIKQKALPNMTSSNGVNHAHKMSLFSENSLTSTNQGEASKNEMDIKQILSIPCYFDSFPISNTAAAGTNVWSSVVSPATVPNVINADSSISSDYLNSLSVIFKKWRGSFKYQFRAVKTMFHSLRIRVWFCPGANSVANIDRNSCISKIVDLKELNQFEFEVPYIWPTPWLNTLTTNNYLGVIGIDVLNQMVNPSTVDPSIQIIVERSAGSDFSFNLPTTYRYFPYDPVAETSSMSKFQFQSGVGSQSNQDLERKDVDDTTFERPQQSLIADKMTLGQSINNVKQLISRSTIYGLLQDPAYTGPTFVVVPSTGTATLVDTTVTLTANFLDTPLTLPENQTTTATITADMLAYNSTYDFLFAVPSATVVDFTYDATSVILVKGTVSGDQAFNGALVINYTNPTTYNINVPGTSVPICRITSAANLNSHPVHIQSHQLGVARRDVNNNLIFSGMDNLSFFSSFYAFSRGGVDLRIVTTGDPYGISVVPDNDINQISTQKFPPVFYSPNSITLSDVRALSSSIIQSINPMVEGYGEINVPFYSSSYCQSISPSLLVQPNTDSVNYIVPDTQVVMVPYGKLGGVVIYRAANSDYEFSYLSGPPLLVAIP